MSKRNINITKIVVALLAVLLIVGCSTKKNKWNRRAYHNLTSHYNVWWNGNEAIREGDKKLREAVKDDYTEILPVFNYGGKTEALTLNADMDRAIEKASVCIQRHSMRFNNKEYVRWIDDAFLVMGQGYFYKMDYIPARRTFEYVASQYKDDKISTTANLWLAKTFIANKQYQRAEATLQSVIVTTADETNRPPRYVRRNLDLVLADFYIATDRYQEAITYLKNAHFTCKTKYFKTRSAFILGQIYERLGQNDKATEQFEYVISRHPDFEMKLEASLNLAKCYQDQDTTKIMKRFHKMLDDTKNADYLDRIYYAMAEVSEKDGNRENTITYLRSSVRTSKNNNKQKVLSSLKAATMLFEDKDYVLSQAYYDTVMMAIDRTYPTYDSLFAISETLGSLVTSLTTYKTQDSLLQLAEMDTTQLYALIDQRILDYKEELKRAEEEAALQKQREALAANDVTAPSFEGLTTTENGWYFYNKTAVTRGMNEFKKNWGSRKLEDYWMMKNKEAFIAESEALSENELTQEEIDELIARGIDPESITGNPSDSIPLTPLDRNYYLRNIPFGESQKKEANKKIIQALNNIGFIYYDNIGDYERSIEAYEELNTRYPENECELPSNFYMTRIYSEKGETDKAQASSNIVITKYPESNYAKILIDPEYFVKERQKKEEAIAFYGDTYNSFNEGDYKTVKANVKKARELYANDTVLMPRFDLLEAFTIGKTQNINTMASALYELVQKYPTSSIKNYAMDVLLSANDMYKLGYNIESARKTIDTTPEKVSPYKFNRYEEHFVIIVCQNKNVRINPLKVRMSDFNQNNFRTYQLTIKNIVLSKEQTMLVVEKFDDADRAEDYALALTLTDYVFGGIDQSKYKILSLSKTDYMTFYNLKNVEEYLEFLEKNK